MTDGEMSGDKEFMMTLAKGLMVLGLFGAERPAMTLSEVATAADLSRATARRILRTLSELGYLHQQGRQFSLSPAVLNFGSAYLSAQSWIERAHPLMKELNERFQESCTAGVLQDSEIVCVADFPARRIVAATAAIGARLPAFHTSLGRIQLGGLEDKEIWKRLKSLKLEAYTSSTIIDLQALYERVRDDYAQGFSIVDEELEKGLRSIAVPILSRTGQVVAAVCLSTHTTRTTRNEMRSNFLPALKDVARQISNSIA